MIRAHAPARVPAPKTSRGLRIAACAALTAAALGAACARIEAVLDGEGSLPPNAHEAYVQALQRAGLDGTPLVERWRAAAETAVREPVAVDPPFQEISFYPAEEPTAMGYAVAIERGQALRAVLALEPTDTVGVFLDVFERDVSGVPRLVASAPEGATYLEFEPPRGGTFVLRVQPELLRSVRVRLTLLRAATLAFPVSDRDADAIRSRFGDSREGGRRRHHGVDIFAPRGTPVLAAADGVVSRVDSTRLGGLVIWLRDERRHSLYYAHLDRQLVRRGDRVRAGDTLGLVGNTGNARTTPPHLHFGLYRRGEGPIDPYAFLHRPPTRPPPLRADSSWLGRWARLRIDTRRVGSPLAETTRFERHTVVRVLGAAGRELRVRLPDGALASLRDAELEPLQRPIAELALPEGAPLLARPALDAPPRAEVTEPRALAVLGRFGGYSLVRGASGAEGWVADGGQGAVFRP